MDLESSYSCHGIALVRLAGRPLLSSVGIILCIQGRRGFFGAQHGNLFHLHGWKSMAEKKMCSRVLCYYLYSIIRLFSTLSRLWIALP